MSTAVHLGAAAEIALTRRLEALANNVANATTPGYRADGVKFDALVATRGGDRTTYPSGAVDYISRASGGVLRTGAPLDLAVRGDAWFSLMTPAGQTYTRDGRVTLANTGELLSVNGYSILDASGSPMFADPGGGEISVAPDGMMTQGARQIGAVGLFKLPDDTRLTRYDNSSLFSSLPAEPVVDFSRNGVLQGYIEQSNADPVIEMGRLIEIQRAFEAVAGAIDMSDTLAQDAIKTLGSPS
ncbi:MAG: flagellar basal-body rod protein FlgF [Hyphomicrobiales bacterium]|nr:flagellar basal-body rod protein FlgF [Hyphomicrobiales bacterium]